PLTGAKIGLAEILTKTFLYYLHERAWFGLNRRKIRWLMNSRRRHLIKTFTWRGFGTADTFLLAWIISGSPLVGMKVGAAELITKMILYYLHERAWYRTRFGLKKADSQLAPQQQPVFD